MAAAVAGMLRGGGLLPQADWSAVAAPGHRSLDLLCSGDPSASAFQVAGITGQLPTLQTVRYGSKAVTRHRRVMHFERQKLMAVTEYIAPKPAINPRCLPPPPSPPKEETGLIRLLRREIAAVFRDNRMIAVCQNVALSAEDKLLMRHQLRKHKILMKIFPNQVLKPFLEDSKYQNLLPLFVGHNFLLVSEEPKVKEMVRILRTVPFLPLLGEWLHRRHHPQQAGLHQLLQAAQPDSGAGAAGGRAHPPYGPDPLPTSAPTPPADRPVGPVRQTATRKELCCTSWREAGSS
ncbi:39S ribosomal protein L10, mitochondrial isoform X2 [Carlito syrichta]|uniref:Large ribosomal subunit protein uL10m n=1 Tax=Carlito syrichta TaxID=1868482 RepID=A0A3Q0DJP2_CARSF|nr:39S ribosomal protein L10, mitochondrial isoform X2 [Carlito syrichta]